MAQDQPLPLLWLLSDARNDAVLEDALARLPRGSGLVFRHYHLAQDERRGRFVRCAALARHHGHRAILSDSAAVARQWGADGIYGACERLGAPEAGLLRFATAHDAGELAAADAARADGVFLSPVFPSRSHPGGATLGIMGFQILAQQSRLPVIALGGMTAMRATQLDWPRWGAIDGLA